MTEVEETVKPKRKPKMAGALAHLASQKPRCGVPKRDPETHKQVGLPCRRYAGQGTNHAGVGPCHLHGGNHSKGPDHYAYKHGLYAKVTVKNIGDLAQSLNDDRDIYDSTEEIRILEALAINALNQGATGPAASLLMQVTRAKERLHNVMVGKKMLISIDEVTSAIENVVVIIQTHVKDKETLENIARDLGRLSITGRPKIQPKLVAHEESDD